MFVSIRNNMSRKLAITGLKITCRYKSTLSKILTNRTAGRGEEYV